MKYKITPIPHSLAETANHLIQTGVDVDVPLTSEDSITISGSTTRTQMKGIHEYLTGIYGQDGYNHRIIHILLCDDNGQVTRASWKD